MNEKRMFQGLLVLWSGEGIYWLTDYCFDPNDAPEATWMRTRDMDLLESLMKTGATVVYLEEADLMEVE